MCTACIVCPINFGFALPFETFFYLHFSPPLPSGNLISRPISKCSNFCWGKDSYVIKAILLHQNSIIWRISSGYPELYWKYWTLSHRPINKNWLFPNRKISVPRQIRLVLEFYIDHWTPSGEKVVKSQKSKLNSCEGTKFFRAVAK